VRNDPEQATQKQYFDAKEQDALDRKLTPNTVVFRAAEVASAKKSLVELAKIDQAKLTPQQRQRGHHRVEFAGHGRCVCLPRL
jgi:hypothetical protein